MLLNHEYIPCQGIILMAATNLPDILDPALIRPGRFDRHVSSPIPSARFIDVVLKSHLLYFFKLRIN